MDWDRGESWEVQQIHETRMRLRAHVANVSDIRRVRKLMPVLRDMPPGELRSRIVDGFLELGEFGTIEGPRLLARANDLGLRVDAERHSTVRHVCFNRTRNCVAHENDAAAAERLASEMIAAGVPVAHVEVD